MNKKLQFKIIKKKGNSRAGLITLNGIEIQTPVYMPVGTKATIKGIILDLLKDPRYIGGQLPPIGLILANTFHLYLNPGDELVKNAGGLHKFENRDGLILTDSGGFQAFSLGSAMSKSGKGLSKITEDGVRFRSPYDGSTHRFTPEKVVDIQTNLGSDIMMVLDVCSPMGLSDKKMKYQLGLTHRRAQRAFDHFLPNYDKIKGVLFPIVQGGTNEELRLESLEALKKFAIDGIAVGGVSVGESKDDIKKIVKFIGPKLPDDVPRYLMGVGTPEDLEFAIENGFDMFDCVLATRIGRHGTAFTPNGLLKLTNSAMRTNMGKLTPDCPCYTCQNFTVAYLAHLVREKEMLGGTLISLHNLVYLHNFVQKIRNDILAS